MAESKDEKSSKSIIGPILLSVIAFLVFSLCFFPIVLVGYIVLRYIAFTSLWHFLLLPFIIYIGAIILIISVLLISGVIIKLFNIRYKPGTYKYSYNDKNSFRWIIICTLYTPCRWILETFPLAGFKNVYLRLLGMKIGKNSLIGGAIKDPCVTDFGNNTTMGEYAVVYGHIHNYEKGIITISKVKVGNGCIVGAGAIIMPGAVLQDNVTLAAGALVTKNQILEKGKTYGGIPAKEITKRKIK